mgnify:CR=1 FL=1
MLQFNRSDERWWQKPLGELSGKLLPAELLVLHAELGIGEHGAWLNSRGIKSGVIDLVRDEKGKFRTVRCILPSYASEALATIYKAIQNKKGATDLIIWHEPTYQVRFVEVKCPHWDQLSFGQLEFMRIAGEQGFAAKVVEWEFLPDNKSPKTYPAAATDAQHPAAG